MSFHGAPHITCWTVTCGGAPRIVACSSNWQWPDRVGVSGFGPQGHIAHKQYKVLQNCDLPLLYVHSSTCSHILLSSIRGHKRYNGLGTTRRACRMILVIAGTVHVWPVSRIMAVFDKNVPNSVPHSPPLGQCKTLQLHLCHELQAMWVLTVCLYHKRAIRGSHPI